jgi:hypothetical protein
MTQRLEDTLRAAFREKADQISAVAPPLDLDTLSRPAASGGGGRPWATARRRWLAPLAAATAVAAVAAGAAAGAGVFAPTAAGSGAGRVPAYYVAIGANSGSNLTAVVAATRSGAVLARITPPRPYVSFANVSGAANDRTFVLAAAEAVTSRQLPAEKLYLLRINPAAPTPAARAVLTPLAASLPPDWNVSSMALSPDARSLAVLAIGDVPPKDGRLVPEDRLIVYSLTTRSSHTWTDPDCTGFLCFGDGLLVPNALSWTSDNRALAFVLHGFRLLNVSAPGHDVLADSRAISLHGAPALPGRPGETRLDGKLQVMQITPDGRSVFVGTQYLFDRESLMRFSARTGALISVLNNLSTGPRRSWEQLLWSSPDGNTLILTGVRLGATAGIVSGGHYTPIPWSGAIQDAAW